MRYCLNYDKYGKYMDEVDELTINFRASDTSLLDFLTEHKNQRINISINNNDSFLDNNEIKIFKALKEKDPNLNFVLKLGDYRDPKTKEVYSQVKDDFKFFFSAFVHDWDELLGYLNLKPTDIYIVENLGFELDDVARILHYWGVNVRAFPNIAQSPWYNTQDLKKFFIRPEDIDFYSSYIDTVEFLGNDKSVETYYKIYAIDKKWFGKLNELIVDFSDDIDNRCIHPSFAEVRYRCGKKCFKGKNCRACREIETFAKTLEKNNLYLKKESKND